MSYIRVIPRDLFNEANLLKCLGRLWIETERYPAWIAFEHDGSPFEIEQSDDDGSLTVTNVEFFIRGRPHALRRPLNSRQAWPLYLFLGDGEWVAVFTDDGKLTAEVLALIEGR